MKKKLLVLALAALVAFPTLTGCDWFNKPDDQGGSGSGGSWNYDDYDFEDEDAAPLALVTAGVKKDYSNVSYDEKANIIGKLESYAAKNGLTGLVIYDDGGYVKYSSRVQIPTTELPAGSQISGNTSKRYTYITGYGFGILAEGSLGADLTGTDIQKANYYHVTQSDDPKNMNYGDDKGEVVGDLAAYIGAGYFDVRATKSQAEKDKGVNGRYDGYEWFGSLASDANLVEGKARPLPVDAASGNLVANPTLATKSTKYRIYVRTGEGAKYATNSQVAALAAFNNRQIAKEDYLTPFKLLWNQSNGWARMGENHDGSSSIKGSQDFLNGTKTVLTQAALDQLFDEKVGIKVNTDTTGDYIEFEFNNSCTPYYAMYYVSSVINAPVPQEFITAIGGAKYYGKFKEKEGVTGKFDLTPVDTTLSTGAYVLEDWQLDKAIVFKKNTVQNTAVLGGSHRYTIPGIYVSIESGAKTNLLHNWNLWKANMIDACGIPSDLIQTEANTNYTQLTQGSSTTKLNLNTCTQEEWVKLFGKEGTITQTAEEDYWTCEPIMSNSDFIKGLNLCINRQAYATNHGVTPAIGYFSDAYLSDPEAGTSYNTTAFHQNALLSIYTQAQIDSYGYDLTAAANYFKAAADALKAAGTYKSGQIIELEIAWQVEAQTKKHGVEIASFITTAWSLANTGMYLNIKNMAPAVWSDVYYKKMMVGQFDIAFGGVSGNTMDPLNFFEVLKSDNSSGFTLNWGVDTSVPSTDLVYDDITWSFDALWAAADHGALVNEGKTIVTSDAVLAKNVVASDYGRDVVIKYSAADIADVITVTVSKVILCYYEADNDDGYDEVELTGYTNENGTITIHVSKEQAEAYQGMISFDVIFSDGNLVSLDGEFPVYTLDAE